MASLASDTGVAGSEVSSVRGAAGAVGCDGSTGATSVGVELVVASSSVEAMAEVVAETVVSGAGDAGGAGVVAVGEMFVGR